MTDTLLRFLAHPLAVIAHILGQPLRAFPLPSDKIAITTCLRIHWRMSCEFRRNFDHRLVNKHGDRIEVRGIGFQAEPLRL